MTPRLRRALDIALTLALAGAGGFVASALQLPVAWLLGPVVVVSAATLAGFDTGLPARLRDLAFFVLGMQAGSGVSPEVVGQLAIWPLSFAIQTAAVAVVVAFTYLFLRRVFGWDRETALFSSLPGALSFVLAAASETRADITRITVVQSVRLFLLICALTPTLAWLESGEGVAMGAARPDGTLGQYALLVGACLAAAVLGSLARVPGGMMLGALTASALMHGTGIADVPIPQIVALPSLVLLGVLIGSRLKGVEGRDLRHLLPVSLGAFVIGVALSLAFALLAVAVLGIGFGQVALAYAPGALEALTVLAFQFDLDPAFVAAHHVIRFLGIAFLVPLLARRLPRPGAAGS